MAQDWIASNAKTRVWVYNNGADKEWIPKNQGIHKVNNPLERRIMNRQAELLMFLTKETDILYLVAMPDAEFIKDMKLFGMVQPRIRLLPEETSNHFTQSIASSDTLQAELREWRENEGEIVYIPYTVTAQDEAICQYAGLQLWGGPSFVAEKVNSKVFARQIAQELGMLTTEGFVCASPKELATGYAELQARGYQHCVIKEPYGSSGKGVHFVKDERIFQNLLRMLRFPAKPGVFQVLLEGWIDDKWDINYQILITSTGDVELLALNEQLIKQTTHKGIRFPTALTSEQEAVFRETAEKIGKRLYQEGYTGVMGIDGIVRNSGEVIPVLEFNGRFNQSTFYIPLVTRLYEWKRQAVIKYYDIQTQDRLDYRRLKELVALHGMIFSQETRTGILILNSACLSFHFDETKKNYLSRVFLAIVNKVGEDLDEKMTAADRLMEIIQKKSDRE